MQGVAELEKCSPSSQQSDEELLKDELFAIQENPFFLVEDEFLRVKTKKGELKTLRLNSSQQLLLNRIHELRKNDRPIRIWALKFRQGGVSTLIEAILYALTSQQKNRNSLIMADEGDKSEYLFQMSKLYHEQLEEQYPHLAPVLKKSNAKSLEFAGIHSQIIIETAENTEAARAFTYQYVHLSEVAFFRDLKTVLSGLNQSVPDHADTIIIGETTANGMNAFYEEWMRATEGKTDWIPVFIPWFMMEEYTMPLQDGKLYPLEGVIFDSDNSIVEFETEEQALKQEFNLTDEQLNWRRWAIVNKCQGNILSFRTEYPSTWQEAFSLSGNQFFDKKGLERQEEELPKAIGEVFSENLKWQFREIPHGRVEVFEFPSPEEQYIVTADASEALGQDEASILVLNKRTNTTAAIVAGQYTPEELADMCISLGSWYNLAMIAPENKSYGYMVCQLIFQKYGNIYKRIVTKTGQKEQKEELGWNTNGSTRPQMLAQMNEEVRLHSTVLKAKKLLDQCRRFVINPENKKPEAQEGYQDGLVICRAIAGMIRQQYPYIKFVKKPKQAHQSVDNI